MRRRVLWMWTVSWITLITLSVRLFFVMLLPDGLRPRDWRSQTRMQANLEHYRLQVTDDGRGRILDRYGRVLPRGGSGMDAIIGTMGLPDVWPDPRRAVPEQGRSGLEGQFDRQLTGRRPGIRGQFKDAADSLHAYQPLEVEPQKGADLTTTVDARLQASVSRALDAVGQPDSAVVVLDVRQGDILAMDGRAKGRPALTEVSAFTPGSVFKLITAAAALESYRFQNDTPFYCDGHIAQPGLHMKCWAAHGTETLRTALAQSCDVAFAHIGLTLGAVTLRHMAMRFGVLETGLQVVDGAPVLGEAKRGVVWRHPPEGPGEVAHLAIGQQDVRLSPLKAAQIALAIADGGRVRQSRLVTRLDKSGSDVVRYLPPDRGFRAISNWTATDLASDMRRAVTMPSGTAHDLAHLELPVAVKTGTAELAGSRRVNAWIVGFAPYSHPEIAFCAYVGDSDSPIAHRAVRQIVREVMTAYKQIRPVAVIE